MKKSKKCIEKEPIISMENKYKFPSCDQPKLTISISESNYSTRFESLSNKQIKSVRFNPNVSVVNIQSHKRYLRKINNPKNDLEEEFNEDYGKKNCINCEIF